MMINKLTLPAITMLLLLMLTVSAKENDKSVSAQWQHKELIIQNRQSFTNELQLVNFSAKSIRVYLSMDFGNAVFFIKKLPEMLMLEPGQKVAIKVAGTSLRLNNEPCIITATVSADNHSEIKTGFVLLAEKLKTPVKAMVDNQLRYFTAANDTIIIPLKMQNYSALRQSFTYSIKDDEKGLDYILEDHNLWMEAYQSRIFLLKIFRNEQFKDFLNSKLSIEIYDQFKNQVLQSFIPVQSVSSFYRMNNPVNVNKGELSVEYRSMNGIYQVNDMRYADQVKLDNGSLSFQLHHQYYLKQHLSQLFNSYLQWNNANNVIKLGEVYVTGELAGYGNGLYLKHTATNKEHEIWGIFNNSFVYSSAPIFPGSKKTFGYSFTKSGGYMTSKYQLGYIDDIKTGSSGVVGYAKQYRNISNGRIEAGLGASGEFSKLDPRFRVSLTAEILYQQQFNNKWLIESNARLTGRHYLGQSRGQQTISARARYLFSGQKQLSFGQYWQEGNPEYYINFSPRRYEYYRLFSEYSFSKTTSTHTLKARYQDESLGAFYFSGASVLHSAIVGYETNHTIENKHFINLSGEIAFQKLIKDSVISRFRAVSIKASWRYKNLTSRIAWQDGILNLNHYSLFRPEGYEQAEWFTQYQLKLPQQKLEARMQFGLYKEDFYKGIRSKMIIDMNYHPTADITFNIGVTRLANSFSQQPEFKAGLVYKPRLLKYAGNKNIRIKAFNDKNGNAKKDEDEQWAPNINMQVSGRTMKTDPEGMIRIQNIPKGNYAVTIPDSRITKNISVTKNVEIQIPVEKMYKVQGRLILSGANTDTTAHQVNKIISFRSVGDKEYLAATDANGTFSLPLPQGKYYISVQGFKDIRLNNTNEKYLEVNKDILNAEIKSEMQGRKINYELRAMQ